MSKKINTIQIGSDKHGIYVYAHRGREAKKYRPTPASLLRIQEITYNNYNYDIQCQLDPEFSEYSHIEVFIHPGAKP